MQRFFIIASACAVLIASGVVHGVWTDRWSDQSDLAEIAKRLDELPMTIGPWHGTSVEMEKDPKSGLAGTVARRYVHANTGKGVTLFLACGRSGPVCTHTPDVCYAGSGYKVENPKPFTLTSTTAQAPPEFWTARFAKERPSGKTHSAHLLVLARRRLLDGRRKSPSELRGRKSSVQTLSDPRNDPARRTDRTGRLRRVHARACYRRSNALF